jgi:molybdenum cofactor cytidylyltransferase
MSSHRPVVLVLGCSAGDAGAPMADAGAGALVRAIACGRASALPLLAVVGASLTPQALAHLPPRDVLSLPDGCGLGAAIAAGVAARVDAPGWVILPASPPLVRPATLVAVAGALAQHPVAYAQHQGRPGRPVGFAAELYSELVQLDGNDGVRRLLVRYPSVGVDVDDPGTLPESGVADAQILLRAGGAGGAGRARR